jgi:hypothetical protein
MSDIQLDRIEARLRTLTILQQRTRLQVERLGAALSDLLVTLNTGRTRPAPSSDDDL